MRQQLRGSTGRDILHIGIMYTVVGHLLSFFPVSSNANLSDNRGEVTICQHFLDYVYTFSFCCQIVPCAVENILKTISAHTTSETLQHTCQPSSWRSDFVRDTSILTWQLSPTLACIPGFKMWCFYTLEPVFVMFHFLGNTNVVLKVESFFISLSGILFPHSAGEEDLPD